jgi:hypothetical protein
MGFIVGQLRLMVVEIGQGNMGAGHWREEHVRDLLYQIKNAWGNGGDAIEK